VPRHGAAITGYGQVLPEVGSEHQSLQRTLHNLYQPTTNTAIAQNSSTNTLPTNPPAINGEGLLIATTSPAIATMLPQQPIGFAPIGQFPTATQATQAHSVGFAPAAGGQLYAPQVQQAGMAQAASAHFQPSSASISKQFALSGPNAQTFGYQRQSYPSVTVPQAASNIYSQQGAHAMAASARALQQGQYYTFHPKALHREQPSTKEARSVLEMENNYLLRHQRQVTALGAKVSPIGTRTNYYATEAAVGSARRRILPPPQIFRSPAAHQQPRLEATVMAGERHAPLLPRHLGRIRGEEQLIV